jgi:hypothetical protein
MFKISTFTSSGYLGKSPENEPIIYFLPEYSFDFLLSFQNIRILS